jgi:iron complex outermembrane receptor protein
MSLDSTDVRSNIGLSKEYSPTTGRIGTVWSPGNAISLFGQYGTGTDPLSGSLSLPGGSNTFDLTKGRQVEVGAKGAIPAIRGEWTVALYKIEKRNLQSRDPDIPTVVRQIGRQSSKGIELALAAEPVRGWTIDANAAFLRARYDEFTEAGNISRDGNKVTGVPERTANIWTAYRFMPQWQAALGARYVGERHTNTSNTLSLPAYTVVDTSLAYAYSRNLTLMLAVKNATNRDYALSGSGNARWLLGEPRTVQLTARTMF